MQKCYESTEKFENSELIHVENEEALDHVNKTKE